MNILQVSADLSVCMYVFMNICMYVCVQDKALRQHKYPAGQRRFVNVYVCT